VVVIVEEMVIPKEVETKEEAIEVAMQVMEDADGEVIFIYVPIPHLSGVPCPQKTIRK
jgi:uncharacterized protein (UPF0212 family)